MLEIHARKLNYFVFCIFSNIIKIKIMIISLTIKKLLFYISIFIYFFKHWLNLMKNDKYKLFIYILSYLWVWNSKNFEALLKNLEELCRNFEELFWNFNFLI